MLETIVTGSAHLGFFRRGGDSLMGRYFLYRMHPLSVAELARVELPEQELRPPVPSAPETLTRLLASDAFSRTTPVRVSALTFLSQLL